MSCRIEDTKNNIYINLNVTTLTYGYSSSLQTALSSNGTWFQGWMPEQTPLTLTIQQPSKMEQNTLLIMCRKWCTQQSILLLDYPERSLHEKIIILSCDYTRQYDQPCPPLNVKCQPLTSMLISQETTLTPSTQMLSMFNNTQLVTQNVSQVLDTAGELNGTLTPSSIQKKIKNLLSAEQFSGWKASSSNGTWTLTMSKTGATYSGLTAIQLLNLLQNAGTLSVNSMQGTSMNSIIKNLINQQQQNNQ